MVRTPGVAVAEVEEVTVTETSAGGAATPNDWGAIVGGALAAIGATIILFTAGAGFGLSMAPWSFTNQAPATFAIGAGIWMIVTQWLSAALGGYMAGRLRSKWTGLRTDEVLFRDTAHGFLAWALGTVLMATLFTLGAIVAGAAVEPQAEAAQATDQAREIAANTSFFTAVSLLVGAFIGAAAGGLGGYHRDA